MAATNDIYVDGIAPACNAEALNGFNRENNFLISSAGMTLSTADNLQTSKAVSTYSTRGDFYIEDGTSAPDAYVLVSAGTQQEVPQLQDGMKFRFEVVNTNTGASSLDIDGLGAKVINYGGSVLQAGMLTVGNTVSVVFNNSANRFDLEYVLSSDDLFIDPSTGNVGIGTTSPEKPLHIKTNVDNSVLIESVDPISGILLKDDSTTGLSGVSVIGDNIFLQNANQANLYINSGGNVGIGTTVPNAAKFQVHSTTNSSAMTIRSTSGPSEIFKVMIDALDNGYVSVYSDGNLEKVRLNSDGNSFFTGGDFGIGTSVPTYKLDISAAQSNVLRVDTSSITPRVLDSNLTNASLAHGSWPDAFVSLDAENDPGDAGWRYFACTNSNSDEVFSIKGNGRVGIGTDSPERKLDVIGDITPPQNYITGFVPSNGSDADHDLDIGIGICKDATNIQTIELTSVLTKKIDTVFAEGTNQGGLAASLSLTANTTYHLFIIKKTDGTTDAYYDTSPTAANIPAAFSYYRRIYSLYTDASANIRAIKTKDYGGGKIMTFMQPVQDYSGAPPTIATNVSLTVPEGIEVEARCSFVINGATATSLAVYGSHPSLTPTASSFSTFIFAGTAGEIFDEGSSGIVLTNTSRQISVIASAASGTLIIGTQGFLDFRG